MRMSKRLNFRMWRESDAGLLYSQDRGRGYAVYLNWKEPSSPDHAREIIRQRLQHSLCWMITFRDGSLAVWRLDFKIMKSDSGSVIQLRKVGMRKRF